MRRPDNNEESSDRLEVPPKLVVALKNLSEPRIFVPPTVDEAVLRAARKHFSKPEPRRFRWLPLMPWAVTAGATLAVVLLAYHFIPGGTRSSQRPALVRADLKPGGQVDILDAFALAKLLQSGARLDPRLDFNGDGVVDERDVKAIAAQAVSLEKAGRS